MAKLHRRIPRFSNPHLSLALVCSAVWTTGLLGGSVAHAQATPTVPEVAAQDDPRLQRLERWAEELGSDDESVRVHAYHALTQLDEPMLPAIRARIERLGRGRPERAWAIDLMSRFRRRGADPDGGPTNLARGALEELHVSHHGRERADLLKMAETAMLWESLTRMGSREARTTLFELIPLDQGLWMPEARNWIREQGRLLTATAIDARHADHPQVRRWGGWAMETLGAEDPGRLIPDLDQALLPDVFRAYADMHVQSAMRIIVAYVDSDRRSVRHAARAAIEQYGGAAIWVLRTAYRDKTGEHAPSEWGWQQVAQDLYHRVDARRMAPLTEALNAGIEAHRAGNLTSMRQHFDRVLTRVAEVEEPAPLAEGYAALAAETADRGDILEALRHYRRALRLCSECAASSAWRTERQFLEAELLRAGGVLDVNAYEALGAAGHAGGAQVHEASEWSAPARNASSRTQPLIWMAAALALLGLALLRRTKRADSNETTLIPEPSALSDSTLPG